MTPPRQPKKRGNPNFVKGHKLGGRPKGLRNLIVRVARCAEFMESEGWKLLEEAARIRGSKNQIQALQLLAAYGYGKPTDSVVVADPTKAMTMADFLTAQSESSTDDATGSTES